MDRRRDMLWNPRDLRMLWFETLSEAMDGFYRSTAFLELMQYGLRLMSGAGAFQADRPLDSQTPTS